MSAPTALVATPVSTESAMTHDPLQVRPVAVQRAITVPTQCGTLAPSVTPTSLAVPASPSFLTQSIKKQPRSPRDQRNSPKRARTGCDNGQEEQDDTSTSTEPAAEVQGLLPAHEEATTDLLHGMQVSGNGTTVFSPMFHGLHRHSSSHAGGRPGTDGGDGHGQVHAHSAVDHQHLPPHGLPHPHLHDAQHTSGSQGGAFADLSQLHAQLAQPEDIPQASDMQLALPVQDVNPEAEEELEYLDFDPLLFIKMLPPLEQVVPHARPALLPRKTRTCRQKTLVLDLDETLVHSCLEAQADSDFTFPVHFNGQEHIIHVRQRPHLHTFMERVSQLFEVVVFTASQKVYAEKLLNIIDPEGRLIQHRIFRESCVIVDGNYLKDLTALGRDLRTTLIVDNSPQAFGFQVDNGVPIESWYDDPCDTELMKLLPFLEAVAGAEDVRPLIRRKYRLQEMIDRVVVC